jgi:hypothetical protein
MGGFGQLIMPQGTEGGGHTGARMASTLVRGIQSLPSSSGRREGAQAVQRARQSARALNFAVECSCGVL